MKSDLVPAAAYVRMSTEDQQYSIANQKAVLKTYALDHGFEIVREYVDAGKSGLVLKYRNALKQLLQDVVKEQVPYRAILVYDVSRWGRFLDVDEAAYYEFICKQAGIPVHYCAETFANNDSLPSAMFKAMKRMMAAEYSRELSRKVVDGMRRLNALGFRTSGQAGYGLRRMLISPDGHKKQILKDGEWKSVKTDRVILVPGPENEVACVREIFERYGNKRMGVTRIVRNLNRRGVPYHDGQPWNTSTVTKMLQNPKYIGANRWGRTTTRLKLQRQHLTPQADWIVKENAFEPIVDKELFERVQRRFANRATRYHYTETVLLNKLKRLARKGRITEELIDRARGPKTQCYVKRFGSIEESYKLVGYKQSLDVVRRQARSRKSRIFARDTAIAIQRLFPKHVQTVRWALSSRLALIVDQSIFVSVMICNPMRTAHRARRWVYRINPREVAMPCVVGLSNKRFDTLEHIYLVPPIEKAANYREGFRVKKDDPLFKQGKKLRKLKEFYSAFRLLVSQKLIPASCSSSDGRGKWKTTRWV